MAHSALPHIWKAPVFPAHVHPFILSLLERFEISFPVGAHIHKLGDYASSLRPNIATVVGDTATAGGSGILSSSEEESLYLIPSLLPEVRPAKLTDLWPPSTSTTPI
jgi:hypothetical protein